MKTIWKFPLLQVPVFDAQATIKMPVGAKVIAAGYEQLSSVEARFVVWAEVDPEATVEDRKFEIVGTGYTVPENGAYIGTIQEPPFVFHVYELGAKAEPSIVHNNTTIINNAPVKPQTKPKAVG